MSSQPEKWLSEFPHRSLVLQLLVDMVRATQCPSCGKGDCRMKNAGRAHSVFIGEIYVPPRCSFDVSRG